MRSLLFLAILLAALAVKAQNLVPNGDLEAYTQCPDYVSQIDRATGWSRPTTGTSDYLNACLGIPFSLNVPDNEFGYQPAHSGGGYAGFYCFYSNTAITTAPDHDREYVTHALAAPLIPGETYAVEFFVSLADVSKYAVNDIGALLSTGIPTRTDNYAITATPQVMNSTFAMLDDKSGWTRIHGCFIADSAFAYITIGNFHVGAATVFQEVPTNNPLLYYSYYFVDDVRVWHLERPLLGPDISGCSAATLAVQNPADGATYTWSTGETGPSIGVEASGDYSVALDMEGCSLSDTVHVEFAEPIILALPSDTSADFCAVPLMTISAGSFPPDVEFLWSTGASTSVIAVDAPGTYTVVASGTGLCQSTATITIVDVCAWPLYAPDAFSPNGDGLNDTWRPVWRANEGATLELSVVDRWGRQVFGSTLRNAEWNGQVDGTDLPVGVYAWKGRVQDPATGMGRTLAGHITLIR